MRLRFRLAVSAFVVLGSLLYAVLLGQPTLAFVLLAAGRVLSAIEEIRNPVDLLEENDAIGGVLAISHGVASGEVTADRATLWARTNRPSNLRARYGTESELASATVAGPVSAGPETDLTARVELSGLLPAQTYFYELWFEDSLNAERSDAERGTFRTAPRADAIEPVTFVFGGDLGGGAYCRDSEWGYQIFQAMEALSPAFFLAMGDMIYADDMCPAPRPNGRRNVPGGFRGVGHPSSGWTDDARLTELYSRHWRYNRADPHMQAFLRRAPMFALWDDHEIINNSGGGWAYWTQGTEGWSGYRELVRHGRDAFFNFAPMVRRTDDRIYRTIRWGADVELFLLDTRSYRSRNDLVDAPSSGKTMLGEAQLAWLEHGVGGSSATWKIIVSSVPLSVPTGGVAAEAFGRDGWANGEFGPSSQTGFERELLALLKHFDDRQVRNLVFLTGDLHQPLVLRYEVDPNDDGEPLRFHEVVAGPLSATPRSGPWPDLDSTLDPRVVFVGGGTFNFGLVQVFRDDPAKAAQLVAEIRDENGVILPGSRVVLQPQAALRP